MSARADRAGFALLLCLLLSLALSLLTAGMLVLAERESRIAAAAAATATARARAEGAARHAFAAWSTAAAADLALGAERTLAGDHGASVRVARLGDDLFLLWAEAPLVPSAASAGRVRAGLLVRTSPGTDRAFRPPERWWIPSF